jgi:hypothetical protein
MFSEFSSSFIRVLRTLAIFVSSTTPLALKQSLSQTQFALTQWPADPFR